MNRIACLAMGALPLLLTACQDGLHNPPADKADEMTAPAPASNSGSPAASPAASAASTPDYLARAGAGDLFEIESSKAVLAKTKSPEVRDFAAMMAKAHEASTAKVKAAAAEARLEVKPPVLTPDQQSMLDGIKSASADTVDARYIAAQKGAHQAALALHRAYAASGDTPALRQAASTIVPVVEQHIAELAELSPK